MSEAEAAAWRIAVERGMNISRDDVRELLGAAKAARAAKRAGRDRDTEQIAKDTSRFLRQGLGRRATEDLEALTALRAQLKEGHWLLSRAVLALRMDGISDRDIGIALGVDPDYARQEVHRRFGRRPPPRDMGTAENGTQARSGV